MSDIILVHRKTNQDFATVSSESINQFGVWKTCLRQIAIFPTDTFDYQNELKLDSQDEVYSNEEALQLLVEILCGLHSPVFGETEVFGQFRKYIDALPSDHVLKTNQALTQFIYKTVKEVRSQYLKNAGGLSYGHVLRKKLKDHTEISLWGFGQLAQEITPWMKEKQTQVIVRNPFGSDEYSVVSAPFRKKTKAHIIAAPISDDQLLELIKDGTTELVIDLRGQTGIVHPHPKIIPLFEVMSEIEALKQEQKVVLPECKAAIQTLVSKYFSTSWHRPFCWEDLCS